MRRAKNLLMSATTLVTMMALAHPPTWLEALSLSWAAWCVGISVLLVTRDTDA